MFDCEDFDGERRVYVQVPSLWYSEFDNEPEDEPRVRICNTEGRLELEVRLSCLDQSDVTNGYLTSREVCPQSARPVVRISVLGLQPPCRVIEWVVAQQTER